MCFRTNLARIASSSTLRGLMLLCLPKSRNVTPSSASLVLAWSLLGTSSGIAENMSPSKTSSSSPPSERASCSGFFHAGALRGVDTPLATPEVLDVFGAVGCNLSAAIFCVSSARLLGHSASASMSSNSASDSSFCSCESSLRIAGGCVILVGFEFPAFLLFPCLRDFDSTVSGSSSNSFPLIFMYVGTNWSGSKSLSKSLTATSDTSGFRGGGLASPARSAGVGAREDSFSELTLLPVVTAGVSGTGVPGSLTLAQ